MQGVSFPRLFRRFREYLLFFLFHLGKFCEKSASLTKPKAVEHWLAVRALRIDVLEGCPHTASCNGLSDC